MPITPLSPPEAAERILVDCAPLLGHWVRQYSLPGLDALTLTASALSGLHSTFTEPIVHSVDWEYPLVATSHWMQNSIRVDMIQHVLPSRLGITSLASKAVLRLHRLLLERPSPPRTPEDWVYMAATIGVSVNFIGRLASDRERMLSDVLGYAWLNSPIYSAPLILPREWERPAREEELRQLCRVK